MMEAILRLSLPLKPHNLMNQGFHFVSCSGGSAEQFAASIVIELERQFPHLKCWLAIRDSSEASPLLEQIDEALRRCASVIVILTAPAEADDPRCAAEWRLSLSYNKPIVVVRATADLSSPLSLSTRKSIDFSIGREQAIRALGDWLTRLSTPPGQLDAMREQLAAVRLASAYATPNNKSRYLTEISALEQQIATFVAAPQDAQVTQERKDSSLELRRRAVTEREPEPVARLRVVNAPPIPVPHYFENRIGETKLIGEFLRDRARCVLTIHGRGGVGKTAMACRVLRELEESDALPDNGGSLTIAAVIYINATRPSSGLFPQIVSGLFTTLDQILQDELRPTLDSANATVAVKVKALLPRLRREPTIVLLDNFEDVVSKEEGRISDIEIAEFLQALTEYPYHALKVIVTSRVVPDELKLMSPDRHSKILLREGLESPHAEEVLRKIDVDGSAGFKDAPAPLLADVRSVTRGFPRALVAFYSIIATGPLTEIEELVGDLRNAAHPAEMITSVLVGEAYSRLLPIDQKVMQAVAIFGRPVSATAVEFVLGEWAPYIDTQKVLKRLTDMQFVRPEARAYHLHPIDRDYVLGRLGDEERKQLRNLAAEYFREIARPRAAWKTVSDLEPHLEQFRLRIESQDAETAASILDDVWDFLETHGGFEQGLLLAQSLEKVATEKDAVQTALGHLAHAQWRLGRFREAEATQHRLVNMLERGDSGEAVIAKGNLLIYQKDLVGTTEELLSSFRAYLAEFEHKYPWETESLSSLNHHVGQCLEELGYLLEAVEHNRRAFELLEHTTSVDSREAALHNLGSRYQEMGQIDRAEELYKQALALADESGNPLWKSNHLEALANCARMRGRFEKSAQLIAESLEMRSRIGDLSGIARGMLNQAESLFGAGAIDNASNIATKAYEHARDLKLPLNPYRRLRAEYKLAQGKVSDAYLLLTEEEDAIPGARWDFDNLLGTVEVRLQKFEEARQSFARALDQSDLWLSRFDANPDALAAKALALSGLAVCGQTDALDRAKDAYRSAIAANSAPGTRSAWMRKLKLLAAGAKQPLRERLIEEVFPFQEGDAPAREGEKDHVFISYAHEDKAWVEKLTLVLSPAIRNKKVEVWYDAKIQKGEKWRKAIESALNRTRVGVLLVSPNFLASDFINEAELPFLLSAAEEHGVKLLWVYVEPSLIELTPLTAIECAHDYDRPLVSLSPSDLAQCLANIAREITRAYGDSDGYVRGLLPN